MTDNMTVRQRSYTMSRIRSSRNASTELGFIKILRTARAVGWRRNVPLEGRPDFVFVAQRLAIFVDGCFWHGCPKHYALPKSNLSYWNQKIARNQARDRRVGRRLRRAGWRVFRFWEHDVKKNPDKCVQRVRSALMLPKR